MSAFDKPPKGSTIVGVISINWNSWDALARCLKALQAQTFQGFKTLKLIMLAAAFQRRGPSCLPHRLVVLVRIQCNVEFAAANNQLMKLLGDFKWVGLLNPAAYPKLKWVERLVAAARENSDTRCLRVVSYWPINRSYWMVVAVPTISGTPPEA